MKDWIELWGRRLIAICVVAIAGALIGIAGWLLNRVLTRFWFWLLPHRYSHWIPLGSALVLTLVLLMLLVLIWRRTSFLAGGPRRYYSRYDLDVTRSESRRLERHRLEELDRYVDARQELSERVLRRDERRIEIGSDFMKEMAKLLAEAEAKYVNLEFLDTTEEPFRSVAVHEGLYANVVYKLIVSMGLTPDVRFSGDRQEPIERPKVEEVILDVVIDALPVNVEILGSPWAVLRWTASGPSTVNAQFELKAPLEGKANLKLLIFFEHDLLFCGDLTMDVKVEPFEWPTEGRPIRWVQLDESHTFELTMFRRFRDLDPNQRRRLNISVHSRTRDEYELLFFLRSDKGKPAVYPLRLDLANGEVDQCLFKTREALRLLIEDANFFKVSVEAPNYSGRYLATAEGANASEASAYDAVRKLLEDMAVVGHELWGKLFGSEVGQLMAPRLVEELNEDGVTIQVWISKEAQDFILPWVWLYPLKVARGATNVDRKSFWGYRYVVEQIRQQRRTERPQPAIPANPLRVSGAFHNFTATSHQRAFFDSYMQYPLFQWQELSP